MKVHSRLTGFSSRRWLSVLFCAFALLFATSGNTQTAGTASVQGTVIDTTGAVIANASVIVTSKDTHVAHAATTGSQGLYSFPNLPIGTYTLEVISPGFARYRQSQIVLEVGSSIAVNVTMTVGAADQSVEVTASGLALQTEDASFKQTIDQTTLTELPLNGRQETALIFLSGAATTAPATDLVGSKSFFSSVVVSIAGGQGNETDYRLDGADNNDYMTNVNLPFPFPDAVSQFSVESTALGAQDGLHPGGLVNVVTRSGANAIHGTAFEFVRNNFINATNLFSTQKDSLHQHQFGGTFGGPVIKDKLFYFAGYQHHIANQNQANTTEYVPTAANLQGDFSASDSLQLLNPKTGAVLTNNKISTSYFDPAAVALAKYLPTATDAIGTVVFAIPSQVRENQFVTRVDATLSPNHTLYGRYFLDGYSNAAFYSPTNILITSQSGNKERAQALTLAETWIINQHTVNTFHASGTRRRDNRGPADSGINATTIGVTANEPVPVGLNLSVNGKFSTYCGSCAVGHFNINTFSYTDDLNVSFGKHQLAFGGEVARSQLNDSNTYLANGAFVFKGQYSKTGPAGTSTGGKTLDTNLDFLTGAMSSFQQSIVSTSSVRSIVPSLYVQDTYHVTQNFVVSGGVRWEPEVWPVDYFNRGTAFNMSNFLANTISTAYPTAPAGLLFYGDKGIPRSITKSSLWQFSPRLGITYNLFGNGKTVLRAGTAFMYDNPNLFTGSKVVTDPPFSTVVTNNPNGGPLSLSTPWSSGTVVGNPFPLAWLPKPSEAIFPNGGTYTVLPDQFHPPYTIQWTASVQQQFGKGWQVELNYIGNESAFLPYSQTLNPAVYISGTCGAAACSTTSNSASRYLFTRQNAAVGPKYAGGGSGSSLIKSGVTSSYNALVASIQHRVGGGFALMSNYTLSHCINVVDAQGDVGSTTLENPSDPNMDRANCGSDYRHIFNTSIVAESHFSLQGLSGHLANNWQVAPLFRITDGTPFTVTAGQDNSLTAIGNDRPVLTGSAVYTGNTITKANKSFLNAGAFSQSTAGTYGNAGRNQFRGPNQLQLDAEVSRKFPVRERYSLELRLESFNLLNHPVLAVPSSLSLSSTSTFGQITSTASGSNARLFQGAIKLKF